MTRQLPSSRLNPDINSLKYIALTSTFPASRRKKMRLDKVWLWIAFWRCWWGLGVLAMILIISMHFETSQFRPVFVHFQWPIDRRTDTPHYIDPCTHIKTWVTAYCIDKILYQIYGMIRSDMLKTWSWRSLGYCYSLSRLILAKHMEATATIKHFSTKNAFKHSTYFVHLYVKMSIPHNPVMR